jgi:hypothetical protein
MRWDIDGDWPGVLDKVRNRPKVLNKLGNRPKVLNKLGNRPKASDGHRSGRWCGNGVSPYSKRIHDRGREAVEDRRWIKQGKGKVRVCNKGGNC